MPTLLTAQSDQTPPKAELFIGYQWLNPGGDIPDHTPPPTVPLPFHLPSIAQGVGTSLAWNFTSNLALEGTYGGDWNRNAAIDSAAFGPKLTWRGDNGIFSCIRCSDLSASRPEVSHRATVSPRFSAAAWISKSISCSRSASLKPTTSMRTRTSLRGAPYRSQARPSDLQRRPPAHRSGVQFWRSS